MNDAASKTAQAQSRLKQELENLFGPKLAGVNGYGAGLDRATRKLSLQVNVDSASSAKRAASSLPSTIDGLPVKISRRGPAGVD